jgi:hypothetical protein
MGHHLVFQLTQVVHNLLLHFIILQGCLQNQEADYEQLGLTEKPSDAPSAEKMFSHWSKLLVRYIEN